jgi:hypothetical protein
MRLILPCEAGAGPDVNYVLRARAAYMLTIASLIDLGSS